mmetsp:Transcript_101882/g.269613  ORF Transcript_101882/g.269613 Transcript_101882/m.269613 type:complete len:323 (-) Transcript_101882:128-1096(-)
MEGGQFFKLNNMSTIPVKHWMEYEEKLMDTWETEDGFSFGYADVDVAPQLLYNASKVPGIFEKVPEKLRGVFWMRGNPIPEILAVLHYGKWFEKEKILLLPNTPWTWAWWGGRKDQYPDGLDTTSKLVYSFTSGKSIAESYTEASSLNTMVSFDFSACPADAECEEGSEDLTYATLMSHPDGDLSKHGMSYYDGYTMEEMDAQGVDKNQQEGALYFRRAEMFCGLFGTGSGYRLTKIIDAKGKPIEPFHSEYLKFMAGRPLIIWSDLPEALVPKPTASPAAAKATANATANATAIATPNATPNAMLNASAAKANRDPNKAEG